MNIVYNSFGGRYSDNPRAIYEELRGRGAGLHHVWLVDPMHRHGFPADVSTVPIGSKDAVAALESADMIISNTHIELDWHKAPGATYLQTWHGTPLKTIHFDVRVAPPGRLAYLTQDVRRWDYLLSPNQVSTERLRRAFGFDGEILETGYPRNDRLNATHRDAGRAAARRALDIGDDVTVILYTPTWRDDFVGEAGELGFSLALDLEEFSARLGPGHLLLLRLHYLLSGRLGELTAPGVRDVSFHPDISDLYLACDAMVTDYSSTMFDFAVTGKPMVFYTYDLDHYRDTMRGMYFDIAAHAPGPLLRTSAEVFDALSDLTSLQERYAEPYQRFQQQFCSLEDGFATQRVVDRFFGSGPQVTRQSMSANPESSAVTAGQATPPRRSHE